jgi:1-acyl-sn-glycerol-3-phosphate acyltransferase
MTVLRSLIFNVLYFAWTAGVHLVAVIPCAMGSVRGLGQVAAVWVGGTLFLLRAICALGYREIGLENMPKGQAIYAVKHQSAWETLFFTRRLNFPAFVLKRELLSIPVFGLFLRAAGMIAINRAGGTGALKQMVRDLKTISQSGRTIIIFPEGTRVAPGAKRKYHSGVAALYGQLDLPVVPVALNSGLFWGRRAFIKRSGTIIVRYLPAIPPGMNRKRFMAELENRIETACAELPKA